MVVFLFPFISSKDLIKSKDAFESKFPVGSSAKIIAGLFIIALAHAVLCCCPPDISYVLLSNMSLIFNIVDISSNFCSISLFLNSSRTKGSMIFSFTDNVSNKLKS